MTIGMYNDRYLVLRRLTTIKVMMIEWLVLRKVSGMGSIYKHSVWAL